MDLSPPPSVRGAERPSGPAGPEKPSGPAGPEKPSSPAAARSPEEPLPGPDPAALHPTLWRASQLGRGRDAAAPTGFAALDAQLPGGGWPHRALTELLLPQAGIGELRLLAPALAAAAAAAPLRPAMWFDPPASLCAPALAALGLDAARLVVVRGRDGLQGRARHLLPAADVLWAFEQALRSGHAGVLLAWLPTRLPADALRRLQLAAQAHDAPAFVLRDVDARQRPSAAPLRLVLAAGGPDELLVRLLKRRGPPLGAPLRLALAPVLPPAAQARARRLLAAAAPRRWLAGAPVAVGADAGAPPEPPSSVPWLPDSAPPLPQAPAGGAGAACLPAASA